MLLCFGWIDMDRWWTSGACCLQFDIYTLIAYSDNTQTLVTR